MTDDDTPENTNSKSTTRVSRRGLLSSLAAAGVLGGISASAATKDQKANVGIGGGSMADEAADLRAMVYEGTLDEQPEAGVRGRYFRVNDPGTQEHGELFEDVGDRWRSLDLGVNQLDAGSVNAELKTTGGTARMSGWSIEAACPNPIPTLDEFVV